MSFDEQQKFFEEFTNKMREILIKKGNDYADSDRLSNFKLAGAITQLTSEQNCLSLIATKVARLGNLITNNASPNNESIDDTLLDLANYTVLLAMIREDINKPLSKVYKVNTEDYKKS